MKPSAGHQGDGIFLVQRWVDVLQCVQLKPRTIAQEYICSPLLIDGYKFDFRVYVLIESLEPLRVYVFREGLARFCTKKYSPPTSENLGEDFMHLTNYSLNKFSADFKDGEPYKKPNVTESRKRLKSKNKKKSKKKWRIKMNSEVKEE